MPVLLHIWEVPVTISSDFARRNAAEIAACASLGLITTEVNRTHFGRIWRVTSVGLDIMERLRK